MPQFSDYELDGIWTPYTPAWTSSGTQPAIGNGSLTGTYIFLGKLLVFRINVSMGSTTTFGTGNYRFGLPLGLTEKSGVYQVIPVIGVDQGTAFRTGMGLATGGNGYFEVYTNDAAAAINWTNTVPHTWANTDNIGASGVIEVN